MQLQAGHGRTSRQPKKDSSERWLLTYSDLITLLLAFFVIMYGISSADAKKFSKFSTAMKRAFNVGVLQGEPDASILEQTLGVSTEAGSAEHMSASSSELETIFNEMGAVLQDEDLMDKVSISLRDEGIAISISGNLLFTSGRAELRPDAVKLLQSVARVLHRLPNPVRVEGHTDDVLPSGTEYPSNWELSGARSVAVVRFLTEIEGVEPSRFSAAAFSQFRPAVANDSARGRSRNRRSEIVILNVPVKPAETLPLTEGAAPPEAAPEEERGSEGATR